MNRILAGLLALALLATPSFAQGPPTPPPVSVLAGQVSLAVSNVSARVAIPSAAVSARALTVYNAGANDAYIATGTVAIVATSGGTCAAGPSGPSCRVPAGSSISFYTSDAYLAAITAASTTTLVIYQGTGPVALRIYGAPNGAAPTGPAGGDLAGTYPNPTVAKATMGTGGLLTWNADTGFARDSVLGAGNLDLGNATANDKSGTLNLGIANIGANGAASVAPLFMNGTILTGGTGTTNFPALLIQPAGTTAATTWNTAGTGLGFNLASGFGGNFIDAYKNGAFVFNISNQGQILTTGAVTIGAASNLSWNARGILSSAGAGQVQIGGADTASPVSQILGIQNVVAGTSNTAGSQFTIRNSTGTGTGIGGNIVFQYAPHGGSGTAQNTWATALTINGDTAAVTFAGTSSFNGAMNLNGFNMSGVGQIASTTLVANGSAPTGSGTCTRGAQTGGNTTGTIVLTCTAQTLILTFATTAPTGYMCEAIDQTTTADTMKQTANSTTTCTLTGTTAASDVILFQARAY